jgi:hypothetical protein
MTHDNVLAANFRTFQDEHADRLRSRLLTTYRA